ncbi:MAG: hypothetical protein LBS12_00985 [Prevotellaceae bacterium]|nr:hypothetical protein [Prevotellaceae bacterium]
MSDATKALCPKRQRPFVKVAFDTTLVALVLSIILMYAVHHVQKKQDDLFNRINTYLIENLINRFYH